MTRRVEITTGARLHFGLLAHAPHAGREFGGAGLMIDAPGFHVVAEPAAKDTIEVDERYRHRIEGYLGRIRANLPTAAHSACKISVTRIIPPHSGLGSGTQLGMAVSRAVSLLADDDVRDAVELAGRVGRGARSAIGIHGFCQGGFLVDAGKVDAGKAEQEQVAPLLARVDFPADWRILLVAPPRGSGLSGPAEEQAFGRLPGMPMDVTNCMRRLVDEQLLPAVAAADFARFSETIHEFGWTVGEYFAPAQGGIFADPAMCRLCEELRTRGIRGVGQSSWGPTLFAFVRSETAAHVLAAEIQNDSAWSDCRVQVVAALNRGAQSDAD